MTLQEYLDAARNRAGINSDNKLCYLLHLSQGSVHRYRIGTQAPSDKTMMDLADLAGVPRETALLDLLTWRNDAPAVLDAVAALRQRIAMVGITVILALGFFTESTNTVQAAGISAELYIITN